MRKEKDSLGEIEIDPQNYWGSQTERSIKHFAIGEEKVPLELIYALAQVKKAAAIANFKLNLLSKDKKDLIQEISDEILHKKHDAHFPLSVWQTGSSTPTNMNVNEVIANLASKKMGLPIGLKDPLHPNDDVNMSQSTNDTVPSAMNISVYLLVKTKLLPSLNALKDGFSQKSEEFKDVIKVGRTHLMDAVPMTLGQEFSAFYSSINEAIKSLENAISRLLFLPLGGTVLGTGINTSKDFSKIAVEEIAKMTKSSFVPSENRFEDIAFCNPMVLVSSALKQFATIFIKIATDITILSSGPRCSISELILPANEPGSSIMPGKVNPTQLEAMKMASMQVMGNDLTVGLAASSGNLQINVFKTVIIYNLIQSINLLSDMSKSFLNYCLKDIKPNFENIQKNLDRNLMIATVLNQKIGYDKAAKIVQKAYAENKTIKQAVLELGYIDEGDFDEIINLKKMVNPHE